MLRTAVVLGGVLVLAAGCVPVQPGYDGYVAGTTYAPGPVYAPDYGYGYGGGVVLYGGSGGYYDRGYRGRDYRGYRGRDYRGGWSGGGRPGWHGNDGNRGGYNRGSNRPGGAPPQASRPRNGLFPGLPAGPRPSQARPPSQGNSGGSHGHDQRERRR